MIVLKAPGELHDKNKILYLTKKRLRIYFIHYDNFFTCRL